MIADFNERAFEGLMAQGVALHGASDYAAARDVRLEAYGMAPDGSSQKGRAARDTGASSDRLGDIEEAVGYWTQAYDIHNGIVENLVEPTREARTAYRERGVSAMYVSVGGLREAIAARHEGRIEDERGGATMAVDYARQTRSDLREARRRSQGIDKFIDQYEINSLRRTSMVESMYGSKVRGLALGVKAVALSCMSESPRLNTSSRALTPEGRHAAKLKALKGGIAALAVSTLVVSPVGKSTAIRLANAAA